MAIQTLHYQAVLLLLLCTVLTVGYSLLYRGMRGIQWFTAFNACALLSAVATALRGTLPDAASIIFGNTLFVGAYVCFFTSLLTLYGGKRIHLWVQYALLATTLIAMVGWGLLEPNPQIRLIAYSGILFLQQAHLAWFLFTQSDRAAKRVGKPLGFVLSALALTNLVRVVGVALQGVPADYLQSDTLLITLSMVTTGLQCGAVLGYVWMTSGILRNDLQELSATDPLTGLHNRRALERTADDQIRSCAERGVALSALLIDLDGFGAINGTRGHHRGDETLIAIGKVLLAKTRRYDVLARMGGDEFAILMPQTRLTEAAAVANRIRLAIRALQVGDESPTTPTVSMGVAQVAFGTTVEWTRLSQLCEKALREARQEGGDRVCTTFDEHDSLHETESTTAAA